MNKFSIFNFQFSNPQNQRGFTVLEAIIAIFVLSLSISGVFSAIQQGLSQNIIAKDEVKAFYLAQEAVEIIRNKRDTNQLNKIANDPGVSWLTGIAEDAVDPCYFDKVCRVDAFSASLVRCGDDWDSCPFLKQDPVTFLYGYGAFPASNFKREVQIELIDNDAFGNPVEIAVTVRISWSKGSVTREFKVKTHLFNWI